MQTLLNTHVFHIDPTQRLISYLAIMFCERLKIPMFNKFNAKAEQNIEHNVSLTLKKGMNFVCQTTRG